MQIVVSHFLRLLLFVAVVEVALIRNVQLVVKLFRARQAEEIIKLRLQRGPQRQKLNLVLCLKGNRFMDPDIIRSMIVQIVVPRIRMTKFASNAVKIMDRIKK